MSGKKGEDIVCAAVSSMTMLVANTIEALGYECDIEEDKKKPYIKFRLKNTDDISQKIINTFREELKELQRGYPENIQVIEQSKGR